MVCLLTPLGRFTVSGMIVLAGAAQTLAQSDRVRDADVDELIEHLVTILKDRQNVYSSIRVTGPIRIVATGETVEVTDETYRGTLVSKNAHKIVFKTLDGMRFEVRPEYVKQLDEPGHFRGEKTNLHSHGGRTALATLALLSAGLGRHEPTVSRALEYLERHPMPGTYGRALRASVYSLLVQRLTSEDERRQAMKLLRRDARWLMLAMNDSDGYTYITHADDQSGKKTRRYDNSNSQFGALGAWVSALAGYNVSNAYWIRLDRFWTREQNDDGGWGYRHHQASTHNMTIAGVNSLIIVLDQLYAKTTGVYRKFEGIKKRPRAQDEIARVRDSIARGMHWLAVRGKPYGEAYTQLGHERLGLASGEKYFGHYDWFREGVGGAMKISGWERMNIQNVSMWLMFLAYGRAPVLVNKLEWGGADSGWDYYFRDMYHVCRFLSNMYEQIYKWQIIDTRSTLYDLQDAPLLYISGETRLWLPQDCAEKVRKYVHGGGMIVGHANLSSLAFARTFKTTFENMFSEWGSKFRKLPSNHPIYQTAFGRAGSKFKLKVPIWGLSDGYREAVVLFPSDVAGAWHQSLDRKYPDLFQIFANLRFYAAGRYKDLPGRLRPPITSGASTTAERTLRIVRPMTRADRGGATTIWESMNELMTEHYGLSLEVRSDVQLANINEVGKVDLVHIPGQQAYEFSPDETRAIRKFCGSGGLILIEALGGDREFARSAARQLEKIFGPEFRPIADDHPLLQGQFLQGKPLRDLKYTAGYRRAGMRSTGVPLQVVVVQGELALIFSPIDLSVSAGGHYTHDLIGYDRVSAQKVIRNILLYQSSIEQHRN